MQYQQILFKNWLDEEKEKFLNTDNLKKGNLRCALCGRPMKAYGYVLTKELVELAFEIYEWCQLNQKKFFRPKSIWGEQLKANTQFQKLKCHGLIKRTKHTGWWKVTQKGYSFLKGNIRVARKVWVFCDEVVLEDDQLIHVGEVEPDWKKRSLDWTYDYIVQPYQEIMKI